MSSDLLKDPLKLIDTSFDNENQNWEKETLSALNRNLGSLDKLQIPSLDVVGCNTLAGGQLVQFRCMIQDMYDPEYYVKSYSLTNNAGEKMYKTGFFRDTVESSEEQAIGDMKTSERLCYYCIPVPGINTWPSDKTLQPSTSTTPRIKRKLQPEASTEEVHTNKRNKSNDDAVNLPPSPDAHSVTNDGACIVKVYDLEGDAAFRLNDVVDVVGVLSTENIEICDDDMDTDSTLASSVPRIHAISIQKLQHQNPALPPASNTQQYNAAKNEVFSKCSQIRSLVIDVLKQALIGDAVAAEILLLHFISHVYSRNENLALGKFSMNLYKVSSEHNFIDNIYKLMQAMLEKTCYQDLSLESLNNKTYVPRKDYSTNRLVGGVLQLSDHTHLMLDETKMSNGQLNQDGVGNLTALGNVITWQKLEYNFQFHKLEYETDIPVLIMSEGKSLLPNDVCVPLVACESVTAESVAVSYNAAITHLNEFIHEARAYITLVTNSQYTLTEDMQKVVQDDFVSMRKSGDSKVTADDLHQLLVLARLLTISHGESRLTAEIWHQTVALDQQIKNRKETTAAPGLSRQL